MQATWCAVKLRYLLQREQYMLRYPCTQWLCTARILHVSERILLKNPSTSWLLPVHRTTLEITEEAFCCFDASEDGYLEREEVEKALTTTSTPGR